jgi:hypothetical protein
MDNLETALSDFRDFMTLAIYDRWKSIMDLVNSFERGQMSELEDQLGVLNNGPKCWFEAVHQRSKSDLICSAKDVWTSDIYRMIVDFKLILQYPTTMFKTFLIEKKGLNDDFLTTMDRLYIFFNDNRFIFAI